MRSGGRAWDELRNTVFELGFTRYAEGSVLCSFGETKVLCNATVDESVPPFLLGTSKGWVTAEYSLLPRSTHSRSRREAKQGRQGGRTLEIQRLIGRSLRGVVEMKHLGERTIILDCDVLQADGGTRTAAITGSYVAMSLAIDKMLGQGVIRKNPIKDQVAAISVGVVRGNALLDLDYSEDSSAEVDLNLVMTGQGDIIEIQGTGEKRGYSREELGKLVDLATKGIEELHALQKDALGRAR